MLIIRVLFSIQRRVKWRCMFFLLALAGLLSVFAMYLTPKAKHLMELHKCPACYGGNLCHDFYSARVVIDNNGFSKKILHLINAKNVYYGTYMKGGTAKEEKVIIKKLGSDSDLKKLDDNLCDTVKNAPEDECHLETLPKIRNLRKRIANLIVFKPGNNQIATESPLTLCPSAGATDFILNKILRSKMWNSAKENVALANIYTLLMLNPEPVIVELFSDTSWYLPSYIGSCGRAAVYKYVGPTLTQLIENRNDQDLRDIYINIALQLLKAADDFTLRHHRFRVYLTDYSLDNICYDETNDLIVFVDLEHVILVDYSEFKDTNVHRMTTELSMDKFIFSTEDLCGNYISDFNILAACYTIEKILPRHLYPEVDPVVRQCIYGLERFKTVDLLTKQLINLLSGPQPDNIK